MHLQSFLHGRVHSSSARIVHRHILYQTVDANGLFFSNGSRRHTCSRNGRRRFKCQQPCRYHDTTPNFHKNRFNERNYKCRKYTKNNDGSRQFKYISSYPKYIAFRLMFNRSRNDRIPESGYRNCAPCPSKLSNFLI